MDDRTPGKKPRAPSKPAAGNDAPSKSSVQAPIEGLNPNIFGQDDYSVIDGETCVGRIYRERIQGELRG